MAASTPFFTTAQEAAPPSDAEVSAMHVVLDLERPSDTDILLLRNGDKLTGTVLNGSFTIRSSYAHISLYRRMIARIDLEGGANNIEAILTVNNNRFSGFIDDPVFVFKLQTGPELKVRREKVLKVVFRLRDQERKGIPQTQFLILNNGDFFSGKIKNTELSRATTYAKVPLAIGNLAPIAFIGGKNVLAKVFQKNGDTIQGVLDTEDIEVALGVGGDVKIYQDRIDTMYCIRGFIPTDLGGNSSPAPRLSF